MHPALMTAAAELEGGRADGLRRLMEKPQVTQCETQEEVLFLVSQLIGISEKALQYRLSLLQFATTAGRRLGLDLASLQPSKIELIKKLDRVVEDDTFASIARRALQEQLTVRELARTVDEAILVRRPGLSGNQLPRAGAAAARDFELLARRFIEENGNLFWEGNLQVVDASRAGPHPVDFYVLREGEVIAGMEAVYARREQKPRRVLELVATHALFLRSLPEMVCIFSRSDQVGLERYRLLIEKYSVENLHFLILGEGDHGGLSYEMHWQVENGWREQCGQAAI
jgi:hypothetical protein